MGGGEESPHLMRGGEDGGGATYMRTSAGKPAEERDIVLARHKRNGDPTPQSRDLLRFGPISGGAGRKRRLGPQHPTPRGARFSHPLLPAVATPPQA